MPMLKVCGLRPGDDLSFTADTRVTHVGFVFVRQSRRCVDPCDVRDMVAELPSTCIPVGVFVDAPVPAVLKTLDASGVAVAQLHGKESPDDCRALRAAGVGVWKVFPVPRDAFDPAALAAQVRPYVTEVDAILLDAAPPKGSGPVSGGHGQTWDWARCNEVTSALHGIKLPPVFVAGGLHPGNVRSLLDNYQPDGVDVSSGVEENGRKSIGKILDMVRAVNPSDTSSTVPR